MVAGTEHFGHFVVAEPRRAGVLRVLEQAGGERLVGARLLVAHDARNETGDRVDHHERSRLPAREDVVTHRQLPVTQVIGDPLVDAFVTTAEQREAGATCELARDRLIERPT